MGSCAYEDRHEPAPECETLDRLEPGVKVEFRGWTISRRTPRGYLYAWRGHNGEGGMLRGRTGRVVMKKIYSEERRSGRWG